MYTLQYEKFPIYSLFNRFLRFSFTILRNSAHVEANIKLYDFDLTKFRVPYTFCGPTLQSP
jgi:hypothetical protein